MLLSIVSIDKKAIRVELEYQDKKQDMGSMFLDFCRSFTVAPSWSFAVSDMYVFKPNYAKYENFNYPAIFTAYTKGPHRFLACVKPNCGYKLYGWCLSLRASI